ncbi:hypothetical protein N0V88_000962 [Collariella sp. IMI 366227]|nr:hypothetical protein N0V88_000962 [Collariella sp. IMI 366227]
MTSSHASCPLGLDPNGNPRMFKKHKTLPHPRNQDLQRASSGSRNPSKVTTASRSESFTTAREEPYSSDDDDGRSTVRPALPSTRTSQITVRQISQESQGKSRTVGLGLGLESSPANTATPKTTGPSDEERVGRKPGTNELDPDWDPSLMRNVTIRKPRQTRSRDRKQVVSDDMSVGPTNATMALRSLALQESPILYPSRRVVSERLPTRHAPSNSESSISIDMKRASVMSTRSNASTVIENGPQRRKTLRHVRKQSILRDSGSDLSPASSAPTSVTATADDPRRRQLPASRADEPVPEAVRDSHASTATFNSISSRKARREVWKHGGVPVVVIPERRASVKSSKSPSLRSTSSRRSRSATSIPASQLSKSKENVPIFERQARRSRAYSESDGSRPGDERTMDFPPVIPTRSSSLSAPTSRNASRTGSLTAESLKAHNVFQAQQAHQAFQKASRALEKLHGQAQPPADEGRPRGRKRAETLPASAEIERRQPIVSVEPVPEDKQRDEDGVRLSREHDPHKTPEMNGKLRVDHDGDPFFGNRLSVQNTPFSVASIDTTGTSHAEVSEAMAVNIYPHQSKSVVLVNHSAKPSVASSLDQAKPTAPAIPVLKTTDANGGAPVTPPQQFPMDDVDSPLRNPRAPPKPPALNFIPATPSGLTPSTEKQKQLGNYFSMTEEKPKRSLSLLRQTLTRRRTEYGPSSARPAGFLTRTFSLARSSRRRDDDWYEEKPRLRRRSTADMPADETRLHPFWRPSYAEDDEDYSSEEEEYDQESPEEEDRTYRYPPIDNRPTPPPRRTRSLSARLRRTFAILPIRNDHYDHYPATSRDAPDRRTIRRTPSGNLRVMKFRRSMESLTRGAGTADSRPSTSTTHSQQQTQRETRGRSLSRRYTRILRSLSVKAAARLGRGPSSINQSEPATTFTGPITTITAPILTAPATAARTTGTAPPITAPTTIPRTTTGSGTMRGIGGSGGSSGGGTTGSSGGGGFLPALSDRIERINSLPRRLSEKRRERRSQELRGMISAPREVRDGVGDVIRRESWQGQTQIEGQGWG